MKALRKAVGMSPEPMYTTWTPTIAFNGGHGLNIAPGGTPRHKKDTVAVAKTSDS